MVDSTDLQIAWNSFKTVTAFLLLLHLNVTTQGLRAYHLTIMPDSQHEAETPSGKWKQFFHLLLVIADN